MGLTYPKFNRVLITQKGDHKCLPHEHYKPIPENLYKVGKGGLILEIKSLPSVVAPGWVPEETYWWTDAQFLPYNDSQLLTTSTAYLTRTLHAWIHVAKIPAGRIVLYDLRHQPARWDLFQGTQSTVYPKVQPHPLGLAFGYAGTNEVSVLSMQKELLYTQPRDMNNRAQRFCAISPNGLYLTILSKGQGFYFLEIFQFDFHLSQYQKAVACHKLIPGFLGSRTHNDHAECKWSPDSSHIALSSSIGKLVLINKLEMRNVCEICPEILGWNLSTAGSYDFSPQHKFSVLAVGTSNGMLCIINISSENEDELVLLQIKTGCIIDCVQYTHDGRVVAVSFRNFVVRVYDTLDLAELHTVCMSDLCSGYVRQIPNSPFPAIMRLSFSYDGRHLATSSCDGMVRVWAIPRLLSLQEWCRKTVLAHIPLQKVRTCNLPEKLKIFLLDPYF